MDRDRGRSRPSLSAPEAAVLLRGPRFGDRAALALALKELVARGYLDVLVASEPRWIGPAKRTPVLALGPPRGAVGNPALASALSVVQLAGAPESFDVKDEIAATLRSAGAGASLRAVVGATVDRRWTARVKIFPDGVTGVPVADAAAEVFYRYRRAGTVVNIGGRRVRASYVRLVVLPALVAAGLCDLEGHRTPDGERTSAEVAARVKVGRWRSPERALSDELRMLGGNAEAIDRAFALLDRAVNQGWGRVHDPD